MKQNVQIKVVLNYDNQSSETIDNQPSKDTIRKDLYRILRNELPLQYEEVRGESS